MNRRRFLVMAALLLGIPLLYALSAGPALYLKTSGRLGLSEEAFARFYHPLIRAEERIPAFGRAMHWYVGLWHDGAARPPDVAGRATQCRVRRQPLSGNRRADRGSENCCNSARAPASNRGQAT